MRWMRPRSARGRAIIDGRSGGRHGTPRSCATTYCEEVMASERDFRLLFETLNRIVESDPTHSPQILALILAGGPFRAFLERPELMNRVTHLAKTFIAEV